MAHNRAQMEAEMMRFEQEISLPGGSAGYRPPVSFIPQQVMRQQPQMPAVRPAAPYGYNSWHPAASNAFVHPAAAQQVPNIYNQPPIASGWPGQIVRPVGDHSAATIRSEPKIRFTNRAVISAPPSVISAPAQLVTPAQQVETVAKPVTISTVKLTTAPSAKPPVAVASASNSAKPPTATEDAAKPGSSTNASKKLVVRTAAGKTWTDPTLAEWDPSDFRIFVGDLGNEATDEMLARLFNGYASFQRARVVRDPRTNKVKGYGFVSFKDPKDFLRAMKEVNGRYCGNRPVKLRKSDWKDRSFDVARKREKEKKKLGLK